MSTVVLTWCQRGIWELPLAALQPGCHAAHPSSPQAVGQGGTAGAAPWHHPAALGHLLLPTSKVPRPGWRALARRLPSPSHREAAHPLPRGSPQAYSGSSVAVLCGLGRGAELRVLAQACTVWGGMGWVPGRWGQAPDAALLSLCTPHVGPGACFGQSCLRGSPSFVPAESWGFICWGFGTSARVVARPKQMLTHGKPVRGRQCWSRDIAWGYSQPGRAPRDRTAGCGDEGRCLGAVFLRLTPPARC